MALETHDLTVVVMAPEANKPIVGAEVVAILDRVEADGGYVVQRKVVATTDAQGKAVLTLWPNSRGSGESRYVVFARDAEGAGLFEVSLNMPAEDCSLADVAGQPLGDVEPSTSLLSSIAKLRQETIAAASGVSSDALRAMSAASTAASRAAAAGQSAADAAAAVATANTNIDAFKAETTASIASRMPMAPDDGKFYAAIGGEWVEITNVGDGGDQEPEPLSLNLVSFTTDSESPALTAFAGGDPDTVTFSLQGVTYPATINGDQATVAVGTVAPLGDGSYELTVVAQKEGAQSVSTTATITVNLPDTDAPVVTVNPLTTTDTSPEITGTIDDDTASVVLSVSVNGSIENHVATVSDGAWVVAAGTLTDLDPGTYSLNVEATDTNDNVGSASATLTINEAQAAAGAVHFDGTTGLVADTRFDLGGAGGNGWALGVIARVTDIDAENGVLMSSSKYNYEGLWVQRYQNTNLFVLKMSQSGQPVIPSQLVEVPSETDWAVFVAYREPGSLYATLTVIPVGTTDVYTGNTGNYDYTISITQWLLAKPQYGNSPSGFFVGDQTKAFVFTDRHLTDEELVAIANGGAVDADYTPRHYWKLSSNSDLKDYGSAEIDFAAIAAGGPSTTEGPDYSSEDGGEVTIPEPIIVTTPPPASNYTGGITNPDTWAETTYLTPGATGDDVTFTAMIDGVEHTATAPPGTRTRARKADGTFSPIAIRHFSDGAATIEHPYLDTSGRLLLTEVDLVLQGISPVTLFSGSLDIGCRERTQPFWYIQPTVKTYDPSMVPAHRANAPKKSYHSQWSDLLDENGKMPPMSTGISRKDQTGTGDYPGLGLIPMWEDMWLVNKTPENEQVLRWSGDCVACWPFHTVDPQTNRMLRVTDHPRASYNPSGPPGNIITNGSPSPITLDTAHMPAFGYLPAVVFQTEFDIEETEFCANYEMALWQNPGYRLDDGAGPDNYASNGQTRQVAWAIRQGSQAWAVSTDNKDYLEYLVVRAIEDGLKTHRIQARDGIVQCNPLPINSSAYFHNKGTTQWQHDFMVMSTGLARQLGVPGADELLGYLGEYLIQRLTYSPHELASVYSVRVVDDEGNRAADWAECVEFSRLYENGNGYAEPYWASVGVEENTLAMQDAVDNQLNNRVVGAFKGYPKSDVGFVTYMGAASSFITHLPGGPEARAVFNQYDISDYSYDPRMCLAPFDGQDY